ncbi:MAG: outer membrane protein [Xanthobacteraceae bacterium]
MLNGSYFPNSAVVSAVSTAGAQRINPGGLTSGFEAGYNLQLGKFVFGLEGDIESFRLSGSAVTGPIVYPGFAPTDFTINSSANTSWLATARGRVGYAADNWLFYVTGGAAFTTLNANFSFADTGNGGGEAVSFSNSKTGYTVGFGVEAGLWGNWTLKTEYLYVNFGAVAATGTFVNVPAQPMFHSIGLEADIARVGLNYRF